jgi:hypothetical protein
VPEPGRTPAPAPLRADSHTLDAESFDANELPEPPTEKFTPNPPTVATTTSTVVSRPAAPLVLGGLFVAGSGALVLMLLIALVAVTWDPAPQPQPQPEPQPESHVTTPEVAKEPEATNVPEAPAPEAPEVAEKPVQKPLPKAKPAPEPVVEPVVEAAVVPPEAPSEEEEKEKEEERVPEGPVVRLFVNTRPAGTVRVDGSEFAATPLDRKLPPGPHRVELSRPDGSDAVTRTFDLQPGADVRFCWDFEADAPCPR